MRRGCRPAGDPALDRETSLQLRATVAGVGPDDRAAFRALNRRTPPAWSPPPEVGLRV